MWSNQQRAEEEVRPSETGARWAELQDVLQLAVRPSIVSTLVSSIHLYRCKKLQEVTETGGPADESRQMRSHTHSVTIH